MKKTKIGFYNIAVFLMALLLVLVVLFCFLKGIKALDNNVVFHVAGELFAMIISIVIFYGVSKITQSSPKAKKWFSLFILSTYLCLILDIVARMIDGIPLLARWNFILNAGVYAVEISAIILFFKFIVCQLEPFSVHFKRLCIVVETFSYIILAARIVMSTIDRYYFYIDENGYYQQGNLYFISRFSSIVLSVIIFSIIIGSDLRPKRRIALISFPVFYTAAEVVSMINAKFDVELILSVWAMVFIYCLRFIELRDTTRMLGTQFKSYMEEEFAEELILSNENILEKSEKKDVSILFVGIADYAKRISSVKPEKAMIVYNHFLDMAIGECEKNNGTVLELTVNGIICVFGVKQPGDGYVNRAVDTSICIKNNMQQLNCWNVENGYPDISIQCGISTGDVVIGYIGSQNHARLSAISREINLCSRLAGVAKENEIVLSSDVVKKYDGELEVSEPERIMVKGYDNFINICRLGDSEVW